MNRLPRCIWSAVFILIFLLNTIWNCCGRSKRCDPALHIQAFTCVEIAHLAELAGTSVEKTLGMLIDAGLGSLPGGGAEVFNPRIRQLTCEKKLSGSEWLEICQNSSPTWAAYQCHHVVWPHRDN